VRRGLRGSHGISTRGTAVGWLAVFQQAASHELPKELTEVCDEVGGWEK
jgi:hypothetical protein